LLQILNEYRLEGMSMPDLLEQLKIDTIKELLENLSAEELCKGLSIEERLKGLSVDDLLAALPPQTQEALAQRLNDKGSSAKADCVRPLPSP
jgi:hypothetical protein